MCSEFDLKLIFLLEAVSLVIFQKFVKQTIGFDSDFNEVTIFYKNNKKEKLFAKNKSLISEEIIQRVNSQLN